MTVDTITRDPAPPAVPAAGPAEITAAVEAYARDLGHCARLAEQIVETPFVPAAFWPAPVIDRGGQWVTLKASGRDGWDFRRRHPQEPDEAWAWRRQNAVATTSATIYSGAVLGLNWQAAVSGIYVANGRTALYAEQMRALIYAAGHRFDIVERTAERAVVDVARAGEAKPTRFEFTMDEAVHAGYVKGKGPNTGQDAWKGNDRYNTNGPDMLLARVTTIAGKAKFADVIRGMVAREIIHDEPVDITATAEIRPVTAADITGERRPAALASALGDARSAADGLRGAPAGQAAAQTGGDVSAEPSTVQGPGNSDGNSAPDGDDQPISEGTWNAINGEFRQLAGKVRGLTGLGQAANRLAVISHIVGRTVAGGRELTQADARMVIENLQGEAGVRLCNAVLHPEPAAEPDDDAAAEPDPVQAARDQAAEAEAARQAEQAAADQVDPTVDAGWPQ